MKRILMMIIFTLSIVCIYKTEVKALSGNGAANNPFIVKSGSDLESALSKGSDSWKYVAIRDTVAVKEMITVDSGKFRIYASGANQTIRRSQSMDATVNSASKPLRCMKIEGLAEVEIGFNATSYKLTINGSKDSFTDNRQCNEWFYVGSEAKLTLCANSIFRNAKNTIKADEAAPIRCYGIVNVFGEIVDCEGNNGGAIKAIGGSVNISSPAKIHSCKSGTEGGAIYGKNGSDIYMDGGSVYSNQSQEEGGGIFTTGSTALLYGGSIYNNTAGKTGGGIFSGNNGSLYFGFKGSGPTVSGNYAKNSGGGVRCNGGTDVPGGVSEFAGGNITGNRTDVSGGGISIGRPSTNCSSRIVITDLKITNNTAGTYGGGICFSEGVRGLKTEEVDISTTVITGNKSKNGGGGIHLLSVLKITGDTIRNNESADGGGVYITSKGTLRMPSSIIDNNSATKGSGVMVYGLFELSKAGYVNESNTVYLPSGKHIDITDKLTVSSILASNIDPEVKTKGTILVDVTYSGGTGESELYYSGSAEAEESGDNVTKKFATTGNHLLRPSGKNTQLNSSRYIVISEKYKVKYNGNSLEPVVNLPEDGIAFWKEKYTICNNVVGRKGFILNASKHWNLSADGSGDVFKPGLDTLINSDTTLYAIWEVPNISTLTMVTVDRYYVVGQKITLTSKELTKKVKVENDLNLDISYDVVVTKIVSASGKTLAQGKNIKTENYINTNEGARFKLYLSSATPDGTVTCTGMMNVSILEDYYDKTEVRFISAEFIDTLDPRSKWKREKRGELNDSLNNETNYIYTVELEGGDIANIRAELRKSRYKINHTINSKVSRKVIKQ